MLDLKLKELKQLASKYEINGRSKMNKEQLITELNKIDGGGKPASKSKSRTNKHKSSVAKQSATFKKPKKTQLKPFPNILEVPPEIPWPSSITTIIAKYPDGYWYTGIVKEKLENGIPIPEKMTGNFLKYLDNKWVNPISYKQFSNLIAGKNEFYKELVKK